VNDRQGAGARPRKSGVGRTPHSRRLPDLLSVAEWSALSQELALSNREADILRSACYDDRTDAIAQTLGLAPSTVHTYRDRLYRKLGVASLTQALALAFAVHVELSNRRDGT
jgi:DNA-binding CsgD family transcriptional regulator